MSKEEYIKNPDKVIWEGWTVKDFIEDVSIGFEWKHFKDTDELKQYVKDNQPYYKKHIPEVYSYFKRIAEENNQIGGN